MENQIEFGWKAAPGLSCPTVVGVVYKMSAITQIGDKPENKKREMIIDASYEYRGRLQSNFIAVQAINKSIDAMDGLSVGDVIEAKVEIGASKLVTSSKTGEEVCYNNVNLVYGGVKTISKAASAATESKVSGTTEKSKDPWE